MSNSKGFTIVELLVSIVLASFALIGISTFVTNTLVNNAVATARSDTLREVQLALDIIARDMRLSANVDVINRWEDPNSPDAVATNNYGWSSGAGTLILAKAALDQDGDVLFQDATNYLTYKDNNVYFVENGTLYRRVLAATVANNRATTTCPLAAVSVSCPADSKLIDGVTGFNLTYLDNQDAEVAAGQARSVEVSLSVSKQAFGRTILTNYSTRTVFRNE